jgi:hypothetical protein
MIDLALATGIETILPAIIAGGTAVATLANRPKPPKPPPVARMPDPESEEVREARRRQVRDTQARSGRESTILANDTYSNSLLGE